RRSRSPRRRRRWPSSDPPIPAPRSVTSWAPRSRTARRSRRRPAPTIDGPAPPGAGLPAEDLPMFKDVAWRAMTAYDLPAVARIAARVHPDFPESEPVLAERQQLYHHGCYLLEIGDRPVGYVLSHPWRQDSLPALDTLLGALPDAPSTYYLHDLALLPVARRIGAAGRIVAALTRHAEALGLPQMS